MPLKFNTTNTPSSVQFNGTNLRILKYNGTIVWQAAVSSPTIGTVTTTYNSATFNVTNTSQYPVDLKITVNGYPQTKEAGPVLSGTATQSFIFNNASHGLTSNITYTISGYSVSEDFSSGAVTKNFTTNIEYTAVPSRTYSTKTYNSITFIVNNQDSVNANLYLYAETTNGMPAGTPGQSLNAAYNVDKTLTVTGLNSGTSYNVYAYAISTDGQLKSEPTAAYLVTTLTQPTVSNPTISITSKTQTSISISVNPTNANYNTSLYYKLDNGSWVSMGAYTPLNGPATATISGLAIGSYHTIYAQGRISGWIDSGTPSVSDYTYLPDVVGTWVSVPTYNTIRVGYDANSYFVTLQYKNGSSGSWVTLDCQLPNGGENFTVPAGSIYIQVTNRSLYCDGAQSQNWVQVGPVTVSNPPPVQTATPTVHTINPYRSGTNNYSISFKVRNNDASQAYTEVDFYYGDWSTLNQINQNIAAYSSAAYDPQAGTTSGAWFGIYAKATASGETQSAENGMNGTFGATSTMTIGNLVMQDRSWGSTSSNIYWDTIAGSTSPSNYEVSRSPAGAGSWTIQSYAITYNSSTGHLNIYPKDLAANTLYDWRIRHKSYTVYYYLLRA